MVVTDVWWLDQVAASALDGHTVFYAGESPTGAGIVKRLSNAAPRSVTVIRSREASYDESDWSADSCYAVSGRDELDLRKLVAIRLRYRC